MTKPRALLVTLVAWLVPAPTLAASLCISMSGLGIPDIHTFVLDGQPVGQFFSLTGADVAPAFCADGLNSFPLSGSAYLRPDGRAQIGLSVPFVDGSNSCPGFFVVGTLNPPAFNQGVGAYRDGFGTFTAVTFSPATCPALL